MIDKNLIINDWQNTVKRLKRKKVDETILQEARELLEKQKSLKSKADEKRTLINSSSKEIGEKIKKGEDASGQKEKVQTFKNELSETENSLKEIEDKLDYILLRIPNFPDDHAPEGNSENDNVVTRTNGYNESDYKGKNWKPHWELASALDIWDGERAAKISGSMFSVLKGQGAKLLHSLVTLAIDLNEKEYLQVAPPHLVSTATFTGTGHLPKFEGDAYKLRDEDLWLIPTGEVPLMGLHRNEVLDLQELPKRYMAYTVCFRREAGTYGKDTRGMQRLHEFHKVELLKLCTSEQIEEEYNRMLADAERILQLLKLPYRIVDLCAGDLTFSGSRIFDIEVYCPGIDKWLEVSSVGKFTDFQSRRGNIRYKDKNGKMQFTHALNGSGMATPRVWAAIIEHYQQPDGSINVPEVLVPYMKADTIKMRQ
jgi:seryl-tRNA synthetase